MIVGMRGQGGTRGTLVIFSDSDYDVLHVTTFVVGAPVHVTTFEVGAPVHACGTDSACPARPPSTNVGGPWSGGVPRGACGGTAPAPLEWAERGEGNAGGEGAEVEAAEGRGDGTGNRVVTGTQQAGSRGESPGDGTCGVTPLAGRSRDT